MFHYFVMVLKFETSWYIFKKTVFSSSHGLHPSHLINAALEEVYVIHTKLLAQQWMEWEPAGWVPSVCLFYLLPCHLLTCFLFFVFDQLPTQNWSQTPQGLIRRGRAAPRRQTAPREWSPQLRKMQTGDWLPRQNLISFLDHRHHRHPPSPSQKKVKLWSIHVMCIVFSSFKVKLII